MSEDSTFHDLIVIGSGFAGLAAAKRAREAGLSCAMFESQMFGGLALNVNELEGAVAGSGADAASTLMGEVDDMGVENVAAVVTAIAPDGDGVLLTSDSGTHRARAVVVASGAQLKKLGVPGEEELSGRGVSHCADCDGPMFQGQDVVVVGGGDSALQSAVVLSEYCGTVHLVHRDAAFTGRPNWVEAVQQAPNIQVRMQSVVEQVMGGKGVESVRVRRLADGSTDEIPVQGFFAMVGLEPATEFLPADVKRDGQGRLVVDAAMRTSMPRVFAAGIVRSGNGGMIEHAMADAVAAVDAARQEIGATA